VTPLAPFYDTETVVLHHGDAADVMRTLGAKSFQSCITSPPYFGARDYGEKGQYGGEDTPKEYVSNMVDVFSQVRRVLADDGTLWLNLGDSYRNKNLLGIPWMVAFALQADGWVLRSEIIWAKPNPMPEPAKDRPVRSHEKVFLLSKSRKYFYNHLAVREVGNMKAGDSAGSLQKDTRDTHRRGGGNGGINAAKQRLAEELKTLGHSTRNLRDVWHVSAKPFPGAHFATYPQELILPCVLAGSRVGDTVLDPFSGSGTTGMVATQEGRKYVGIDLSSDYLDLSLKTRFAQPVLNLGGTP